MGGLLALIHFSKDVAAFGCSSFLLVCAPDTPILSSDVITKVQIMICDAHAQGLQNDTALLEKIRELHLDAKGCVSRSAYNAAILLMYKSIDMMLEEKFKTCLVAHPGDVPMYKKAHALYLGTLDDLFLDVCQALHSIDIYEERNDIDGREPAPLVGYEAVEEVFRSTYLVADRLRIAV